MMRKSSFHTGLGGEFRLILRDANGRPLHDTGWFDNLITDDGLDLIAGTGDVGDVATYLYIGSDATPPVITDTQMGALLAATNTFQANDSYSAISGPNYERARTRVRRFPAGTGTGTVREVGAGTNAASTQLFARHLVTPAIAKAADQVLDVYYRLWLWPDINDVNGTVTLDGILYDTVLRPCDIDNTQNEFYDFGPVGYGSANASFNRVYDGAIGAITGFPAGTNLDGGYSRSNLAYTPGTYYRDHEIIMALDSANLGAGIRCVTTTSWPVALQTSFSSNPGANTIPKDNTEELTFRWRVTWSRRP